MPHSGTPLYLERQTAEELETRAQIIFAESLSSSFKRVRRCPSMHTKKSSIFGYLYGKLPFPSLPPQSNSGDCLRC
jgi:hypothetical protein